MSCSKRLYLNILIFRNLMPPIIAQGVVIIYYTLSVSFGFWSAEFASDYEGTLQEGGGKLMYHGQSPLMPGMSTMFGLNILNGR